MGQDETVAELGNREVFEVFMSTSQFDSVVTHRDTFELEK
jgi:hypothetical protein